MGMFDDIKCEYPLPRPADPMELKDLDFNSLNYQTKDLDESMNQYTIKADGTLWIGKYDSEYVDGDKKGKTIMDRIGHMKILKEWEEPVSDYTGTINFYDGYGYKDTQYKDDLKNDYWIEYVVVFVSGKLTEIKVHKFTSTDNAERKVREAQWKYEHEQQDILWGKWYMKYGYVFYDRTIRWCFGKWRRLLDKLPPAYKIEQWLRPL